MVGHADKIVVYNSTPSISISGENLTPDIIYSSADPKDIAELMRAISVAPPRGWFRCACIPPIEIDLSARGKSLGVITIQESLTIGFSRWSGDARLADEEKLLKWFDVRGITGPRRRVEAIHAREKADLAASERWLKGMPAGLRPLWRKAADNRLWWIDVSGALSASVKLIKPALEQQYPDSGERTRALFSWFGSGAGPWSGYPADEDVVSGLLLEYQPAELLAALQNTRLTDSEMEGAARFFSGYCHGYLFCPVEENKLLKLLPAETKKSLLDHVLAAGDEDKVSRARHAFGER
ncbi:MAG TPA: hypothetical protein VFF39_18485 [Verrucomicrobiae bacterium]|nr:hypothetical protein [Verrucomicrobiae bacterium]